MAIKKISFRLEIIEHTAAFVRRSHLTKGSHTACCCANVSVKGVCQPELIFHSGSQCLCSMLITNSSHYADTSHLLHQRLMWQLGQQITGRSQSKQGNTLLYGFVAEVTLRLLPSNLKQKALACRNVRSLTFKCLNIALNFDFINC